MERVSEVDQGIARERRRFAERYRALNGEYGHDREEFARRWEPSPRRRASTSSTS